MRRLISVRTLALAALALSLAEAGWNLRGAWRPHVIFLVLDTLRTDRLGTYGSDRGLTPFLDRLASRSIVYERAYSPSSWTLPVMASLFVGQAPSQHQVVRFKHVLPDDQVTVAEVLHAAGYRTVGITANSVVGPEMGFYQGFDRYELIFKHPVTDAKDLNAAVVRYFDSQPDPHRPTFLYVHYMEPHTPYRLNPQRPPAGRGRHWDDRQLNRRAEQGAWQIDEHREVSWSFTPEEVARLQELYDGEVAYLDSQLDLLFRELERRQILRDAIVVVITDHGEEFGEHGLYVHGVSLYENLIRVPLLVAIPGVPASRVRDLVETGGIAPLILERLGIAVPETFHFPAVPIRDSRLSGRHVRSELLETKGYKVRRHERAVVGDEGKLVVTPAEERWYFDLRADSGETQPIENAAFAGTLRGALQSFSKLGLGMAPKEASIDQATRERLHGLGYLVD
jgi:arylsulfatase A-like enzyme